MPGGEGKSAKQMRNCLELTCKITLRVQVSSNHILAKSLYYKYNYPKPKYLIIGYMDP